MTVRLPVFLSFFNWNTKLSNQLVRCKTSVVANWSLAYSCASCTLFVSIFSSLQLLGNFQLVPLKYDHFGFTALNLKAFKPYIADCSLQMTLLCRYYAFSFNPMTISVAVILHFITNGLSLVLIFFQVCFILHVQFGGQPLLKGLCGSLLNVESNVRRYRKWWAVSLSDFDLLNLKLFFTDSWKIKLFWVYLSFDIQFIFTLCLSLTDNKMLLYHM